MPGTEKTLHLYLSPHFDDAVFSCGGRIWTQTQAGESVVVITVFGGTPRVDASVSRYARELHARWGLAEAAVQPRRAEDVRALDLLGAGAIHWHYLDCIYRRTSGGRLLYPDEAALWGEVDPSDAALTGELAGRIRRLVLAPEAELYAPLAIGRHVDHRIVRRAAEASRRPLNYYEDFPYAQDPQARQEALTPNEWEPERVPLSEQALQAKEAAIACYRSQISTFWTSPKGMAASIRAFAEWTGSGTPAERYWRPAENG